MPSTNKTSYLALNQWLGSDKPKRADFNRDNLNIDNALKGHAQDAQAHVTAEDRGRWDSGAFEIGSYAGDGTAARAVELGYRPRVVLLFTAGRPLIDYVAVGDTTNQFSAVLTPLGSTPGITADAAGFSIAASVGSADGGVTQALNQRGKTYIYLAFK